MDTFKIIVIIFLMILTYQIYQINCVVFKDKVEGFEGTTQSVYGIDDTNAINTLAQIAKNLLAGGVTVPGNMNIKGGILDIKAPGDWGLGLSLTGGDKEAPFINFINKADGKRNGYIMGAPDKFILSNNLEVAGRNILAELDKCIRSDRQYYLDIGARANGDACCGANSKGLIIHGDANLTAAGWGKDATTRFTFRQA